MLDAHLLNQLGIALQFVSFWFVTPQLIGHKGLTPLRESMANGLETLRRKTFGAPGFVLGILGQWAGVAQRHRYLVLLVGFGVVIFVGTNSITSHDPSRPITPQAAEYVGLTIVFPFLLFVVLFIIALLVSVAIAPLLPVVRGEGR
jgi:hypothetical protein